MDASDTRTLLLEQHRRLRELLMGAERLAERYLIGEQVAPQLARALAELRAAFADHNVSEEAALVPLLRGDADWGPARIARMIEEHAAEHAIIRELLTGDVEKVAADIADIAEDILAHMEAEERTFLSPRVLRTEAL